ncbi:hypothetical protein [Kibdelosporangium philippinense]|uniref:hypothetical protein n=1 Tax=Kibdelosporangium philippinense TaxID=211113 RepID=UPI003609337F
MIPDRAVRRCTLIPAGSPSGCPESLEMGAHMADLAYAVLLIGVFAVLALVLRGLERL